MDVKCINHESPFVIAFLEKFGGTFESLTMPCYCNGADRYELPYTFSEFYAIIVQSVAKGKILFVKWEPVTIQN
jgi:hypothetical protein